MYSALKRLLVGRPLPSAEQEHQRLIKTIALAVFSSDAISSTAYATEEILHVLVPLAALAALGYLVPISMIVIVLLAIVAISYRQTIFAYPGGGGSYVVSRENLGTGPSLVAAASLLTDYVLTVAVSVSAGVAAIVSAKPDLVEHRVEIGLVLVALLTVANLRGVKESGQVFAIPTYVYIVILGALIGWGLCRLLLRRPHRPPAERGGAPRVHQGQGGPRRRHPLRPDAGLLVRCGRPHRGRGHLATPSRCSSDPRRRTPPGPSSPWWPSSGRSSSASPCWPRT